MSSSIEPIEYNSRLREITAVLRRHNITKGVTPEKLRLILEDLGPTFIKLWTDHVHAFGYSSEALLRRADAAPVGSDAYAVSGSAGRN